MPPYSGDENVNTKIYFVGYGLSLPVLKRNDLAGLDVRGKVVVLRDGPPPEIGKEQWKKAQAQLNVLRATDRARRCRSGDNRARHRDADVRRDG